MGQPDRKTFLIASEEMWGRRLRLHLHMIHRSPDYGRLAAHFPDLSTQSLAVTKSQINAAYFVRFSRTPLALAATQCDIQRLLNH